MYKWHQVKVMWEQGKSIKKISKDLCIARNTVRQYIREASPPAFKGRRPTSGLEKYKADIVKMVETKYIGTKIHEELQKKGYAGSLSAVHKYLHGLRAEETIRQKVTTRFETKPGQQMQYDWTPWTFTISGHCVEVYFHGLVLGYSRKKYYSWSLRIRAEDVIRAIEDGIRYFGGVCNELVIDNPKQEVVTHKKNGVVRYTDEFLRFCGLYGITPNACRPCRARTKGKVERPFYYLEEHLLRGLEIKEIGELDGLLASFTDGYNARPHSTLREAPDKRFEEEKKHLRAIPSVDPTLIYDREIRKVSSDGYISWKGGLYFVPMTLCLHNVMAEEVSGRTLKVYDLAGNVVVEHPVRLFDKTRPEHPEHAALNEAYLTKKESLRAGLIRKFKERFPKQGEDYLEGLKKNTTANLSWQIEEILSFCRFYRDDQMSAVLDECIRIGAYHKNTVKRLLSENNVQLTPPESGAENASLAGLENVNISRALLVYHVEASHE